MKRPKKTKAIRSFKFGRDVYSEPEWDGSGWVFRCWRYADTGRQARAVCHACPRCGLRQTKQGHDPCIANLPGVQNACCGHGKEMGYVQFDNGKVIRGYFA